MSAIESTIPSGGTGSRSVSNRWLQLFLGIVCMAMIANLQYGWTLFVNPIADKYGWTKAAIQVAFTIFVLAETWLVPLEGYLVDRFGPRPVVLAGGVLCGVGWVINSMADTLTLLYVAAAISGAGAGAVYGTCVGNAAKWFDDKRGLAVGLTAAGFGAGSALTILPISAMIQTDGFQSAFFYFGIIQGGVVFLVSLGLTDPRRAAGGRAAPGSVARSARTSWVPQSGIDFTPLQMMATPSFWLMYLVFVLVAAGGLTAVAQLGPIAKDFRIADIPVSLAGIVLPALTFALSIDRVLNGLTRPFFGWVSDNIGRERTMLIAFSLEALGILMLFYFGSDPVAFVVLSGLVFFAWGEIYSLFPSTCTDTFGTRYAAANAGTLYTAKGTAALLVPFSSVLTNATGNWHAVFLVACVMNALAAALAWFALRPVREAHIESVNATLAPGAARPR
jgi:OFA family oxalate/formate antiporter-like MFS transporter